jgi:hypothetical protein
MVEKDAFALLKYDIYKKNIRTFNPIHYYYLNPDFSRNRPIHIGNTLKHWLYYGRFESRVHSLYSIYPNFRADEYRRLNSERFAEKTTVANVETHFLTYGIPNKLKFTDEEKNRKTEIDLSSIQKVCSYLRHNHVYIKDKEHFAFVVTTHLRTSEQQNYLIENIRHIRKFYPKSHIYILDDCSPLPIPDAIKLTNNISIHPTIAPKAGELNPYLFILSPECKYEKLIYIHDSAFLKQNINHYIHTTEEVLFLWYSRYCFLNDVFKPENKEIYSKLEFYLGSSKIDFTSFFHILCKFVPNLSVKFGCMSIFTRAFSEKIKIVSNLFELAHLFKSRTNRCFFERILTLLYIAIYGREFPFEKFVCGDINMHPLSFYNKSPHTLTSSPFTKVWQGR